jgi:hypothetical protein
MIEEILFPLLSEREDLDDLRQRLIRVGEMVRDHTLAVIRRQSSESLATVAYETAADKIYVLDRAVESVLLAALEQELAPVLSFALICEGINDEQPLAFPAGCPVEECAARLLVDPIDGTRPIMYNKRSAWWLAGLAPNRGEVTSLRDIELAVQVEIPTTRALLADTLWAIRDGGAHGETVNLISGERTAFQPRPSTARSIAGGFASFFHPFPGGRETLAAMEEELFQSLLGGLETSRNAVFDDQYLSTGGQLYELLTGRDRLLVDVRALLYDKFRREGRAAGHSCHPYDLATILIAEEAGVVITDGHGAPLDAPFDTVSDVAWIGYANATIQAEVEPRLQPILETHELL